MNIGKFALEKSTLMVVLTLMVFSLGSVAFQHMGRLEDPTFTIKTALVITPYYGASPKQVEEEVTDTIEEAIKAMGQVKEIYSNSEAGISYVYVDIKNTFKHDQLPQIWDELRRKVNDVQGQLPPGAGPSIVRDDFGDVYGVFFALHGKKYSNAELKNFAQYLKKELLLCDDVAKVDFWGIRQEAVYIEFERAKIAQSGLSMDQIVATLNRQNIVEPSGQVDVDTMYTRISPTGEFKSEQEIADLLIPGRSGNLIRLGDIATIYRDYTDPPQSVMRFDGKPAIGIGVSTIAGGNVIIMGDSIAEKIKELSAKIPQGMTLSPVYYQSLVVTDSVNTFLVNLLEAVAIVIALLMVFMGWRSGMLIGIILLLTIFATFIGMALLDINLQKVSLGALILSLGMLVDNAIVVADGILIRMGRGEDKRAAAILVVRENAWPLLGATMIAILAFAAIGFSPGNVGEYTRSLFSVMALSLSASWVIAVTLTPLFCTWFLKVSRKKIKSDPYDTPRYRLYQRFISLALRFKLGTMGLVLLLLAVAMFGFTKIPQSFFPDSTQKYFYVNYWKPEGTHINKTLADIQQIESHIKGMNGVKNVTSFVGEGALRFILSYDYQIPDSSYGQLLVEVDNHQHIDGICSKIEEYLNQNFPDTEPFTARICTGITVTYQVEARFRGPDIAVLQKLAQQAKAIMRENPNTRDIRTDWRQKVRVIRPDFSEVQARRAGMTRSDLSKGLQWNFNGVRAGIYREGDELIPIIARPPENERASVEDLNNVQIWTSGGQRFVPINQIVTGTKNVWEWPIIKRHDQQRSITVQCNPIEGNAEPLRLSMKEKMEAIKLPPGYTMSWVGEYDSSQESKAPLAKLFPVCVLGMFLILVWLFNSVKKPLVILLIVPLSIIGITAGLLLFQIPFGFMSILGFLGLSGMLIKNAIVLIEQIQILKKETDLNLKQIIIQASTSRMRPVVMASGTTILGMIPLISDPLFSGMAVTIMGGLLVATVLTLVVVPVLYGIFHFKQLRQ